MIEVRRVQFYSGGKRDEVPKTIFTHSGVIRVHKIIETRLEEDYQSGRRKMVFIFKSIEDNKYRLESSKEGFKLSQL